jgi:hypothetical protein
MTSPLREPEPLRAFLLSYRVTERELVQILQDGAEEAERLLPKLIERYTTGNDIRASQILLVLRELRAMQAALWGDLYPALRKGISDATLAAAAQVAEDRLLRRAAVGGGSLEQLRAGILAQARAGIPAALAKGINGIPLATSVYRTQVLARGWVDRKVRNGLLLGRSAKEISKDVKDLIRPGTPGGVSFAAFRLARTEINNAFHTETIRRQEDKPWNIGMEWHLSRSHPKDDPCDLLVGEHPRGNIPRKPHPQCLCYVTPLQVDEDMWINNFVNGTYDEYFTGLGFPVEEAKPRVDAARNRRQAALRRRRNARG